MGCSGYWGPQAPLRRFDVNLVGLWERVDGCHRLLRGILIWSLLDGIWSVLKGTWVVASL